MRTIHPDDPQEPVIYVSDEACTLVDRIAAALMRQDPDAARLLAYDFEFDARQAGREAGLKEWREMEDENNRRNANFGHGHVVFRMLDGFEFKTEFPMKVHYGMQDWPHIYKTAIRLDHAGLLAAGDLKANMNTPIPQRTYERNGWSKEGLPVYSECP